MKLYVYDTEVLIKLQITWYNIIQILLIYIR